MSWIIVDGKRYRKGDEPKREVKPEKPIVEAEKPKRRGRPKKEQG